MGTITPGPNLQPAIDQLKALAAHSGDRLLLGDGPPNPDAELLAARVRLVAAAEEINRFNADETLVGLPFGHPLVLQEEAAIGRALDVFWNTVSDIIKLPARTQRGVAAKAACLGDVVERLEGCDFIDDPDLLGLISSLTADVLGETAEAREAQQ